MTSDESGALLSAETNLELYQRGLVDELFASGVEDYRSDIEFSLCFIFVRSSRMPFLHDSPNSDEFL